MINKDKCQKCGVTIGRKAYYVVSLDCIYDGKQTSACKSIIVCSNCHKSLKSWLKI